MTLIEQIKADQISARKNRIVPVASLLTTLIGEAEMVGKNARNGAPTDDEVKGVVTKFMKGNKEIISTLSLDDSRVENASYENSILSQYLPKQMSEDELRLAIADIGEGQDLHELRYMGEMMKTLKNVHGGTYDGRLASTLVKEYLNS